MNDKTHKGAFTLVELIVVIVILGILSTIGFVSYNGYLGGARDSNRIGQLKNINDALNLYGTKNSFPIPSGYITVSANGEAVGFQGYADESILELIGYTNGGRDPKDESFYTYYLSGDKKKFQLLTLLEEQNSIESQKFPFISQTYAVDYRNRFPKVYGKKLGILTQTTTHIPIQELSLNNQTLDIVSTNESFDAYLDDSQKISGTGSVLVKSIPNANCKRIKEIGGARGNGIYTINPGGLGDMQVYCDMESGGTPFIKYFQNENELVAGYNFENILQDFSKNSNHGTMTSGSGVYTPGLHGSAILFSGGPYMSVPNSPSLNFTTNQYTFSAWVNFSVELTAQSREWPTIINKRPWCTSGYLFGFGKAGNHLSNHICEGGVTRSANLSNLPFLASKWTHFIGTFDGSTFKIFMNGTQMISTTYVNPILNQSSTNMAIGPDYQGMLDSLRIYNRALSDREIQALYREGL